MTDLQKAAETLAKKGFSVRYFAAKEEAAQALLTEAKPGESVGVGGSVTIRELGVMEALKARGPVFEHWSVQGEEIERQRHLAQTASLYLCSTNALSMDGVLVNIDGAGNRVASMLYGPGRAIVVAGRNKLAPDVAQALLRVRNVACPLNARRHGMELPCAKLGHCIDPKLGCQAPQRMCRVTTLIEQPLRSGLPAIWLVEADLGY